MIRLETGLISDVISHTTLRYTSLIHGNLFFFFLPSFSRFFNIFFIPPSFLLSFALSSIFPFPFVQFFMSSLEPEVPRSHQSATVIRPPSVLFSTLTIDVGGLLVKAG